MDKISYIMRTQFRMLRSVSFYLFRIIPLKRNKIIFYNFFGNGYGDSPKYLAEELLKQGVHCDMVWMLRKDRVRTATLPKEIRPVAIDSLKSFYEVATARVWVSNTRLPHHLKKRFGQYYIQTFHGGPSLKKVEKDVEQILSQSYIQDAQSDSRRANLILSNSTWFTNLIRRSFWYAGEVLECGFPRNDIVFREAPEVEKQVRNYFGLTQTTRLALYAPTFRDGSRNREVYDLDVGKCLAVLSKRFGGTWTLLIRFHPHLRDTLRLELGIDFVDATEYDDVQELLSTVDVLITDYSGLMFDFALRRLPVFLYTPDVNEYASERNFYFSLEKLPFSFALDNNTFATSIVDFDDSHYVQRVNSFMKSIGVCDNGTASKVVVERIKEQMI